VAGGLCGLVGEYSNDTLGDGQAFVAGGAIITSGHLQALVAAEKS
jgi:hypothetical protein